MRARQTAPDMLCGVLSVTTHHSLEARVVVAPFFSHVSIRRFRTNRSPFLTVFHMHSAPTVVPPELTATLPVGKFPTSVFFAFGYSHFVLCSQLPVHLAQRPRLRCYV